MNRKMEQLGKNYGWLMALTGIFLLLVHGARLFSPVIGIDTEDIIRLQDGFYDGWLQSGRFGLVLLKKLLGTWRFQPYFANVLSLVLLWAGVMAFFLLWDGITGQRPGGMGGAAWLLGSFLWISHPVVTEQLYFALQGLEISLCLCLTSAALYFSRKGFEQRYRWMWGISVVLLTLTFGSYQIFVVLYIFGVLSVLLLEVLAGTKCGTAVSTSGKLCRDPQEFGWKRLFLQVLSYAGIFLTAFLTSSLASGFFAGNGSTYLSGQIQWGGVPVKESLLRILHHGYQALTGRQSVYYQPVFGLLVLVSAALLYVFCRKRLRRCRTACIAGLLLLAALLSTPFWMTFLCGGAPVLRSQLVLPAVTGFLAYFDIYLAARCFASGNGEEASVEVSDIGAEASVEASDIKAEFSVEVSAVEGEASVEASAIEEEFSVEESVVDAKAACRFPWAARLWVWIIAALCAPGVWAQAQVTLGLYYTEECRYAQDEDLARAVMQEVEGMAGTDRIAVIFVGSRPFRPNNACVEGETMGRSFFDYDTCVEPECYWSSRRAVGFLHTLGYSVSHASVEDTREAVERSAQMPDWPAPGSVRLENGIVTVKLSEPSGIVEEEIATDESD